MQRVAAVLFIPLLFLAGYLLLDKKANTHWNDITVPHGMHQTLTLSDGTKLHVNSGTRVIYPSDFTENKREIFVIGKRWIVERTFSWFDNYRRLCRNYELTFDSAEEMVKLASIRMLLNKI